MTDSILKRREGETDFRYKVRLCVAKLDKELHFNWDELRNHLGLECSSSHLRKLSYAYREMVDNEFFDSDEDFERVKTEEVEDEVPTYKETLEIKEDGTHFSDKLIQLSEAEMKSPKSVMEAHGYDPDEWQMMNVKSSLWHHLNKKMDNPKTLHACKITVKPKITGFDFDKLIDFIENKKPAKRIEFKGELPKEKTYLEIPLFDMHLGNSTLEYYQQTLQDILALLDKSYHEVLFIVGQDLFHNDNFKGQTANGTQIDKADMEKAWDDAEAIYFSMLDKAIYNSKKVTIVYNKGNHDESMAYAFVRNLKTYCRESDVEFDTDFKERKAHMLGSNFIGTTHGDKNRGNLASNFSVEFPMLWSQATTREVHIGHLHHKRATKKPIELINDKDGLIVRELGTGNKIDGYHEDRGYTMAHSEFEIFEYTETKKKRIHYV